MLCVLILYISSWIYSLKSTPNDRFFGEDFHGKFYLMKSPIVFHFYIWYSNPGFSSNKPTHYLLDHCDFKKIYPRNYWEKRKKLAGKILHTTLYADFSVLVGKKHVKYTLSDISFLEALLTRFLPRFSVYLFRPKGVFWYLSVWLQIIMEVIIKTCPSFFFFLVL